MHHVQSYFEKTERDHLKAEALAEVKSKKIAHEIEGYFVCVFDTFNNGLNKTPTGTAMKGDVQDTETGKKKRVPIHVNALITPAAKDRIKRMAAERFPFADGKRGNLRLATIHILENWKEETVENES